MVRISEEEINAVRSRADIVDVIGRYLQVQRKGKSYVAICPFHDDHSPSMSISPDKQIYKCFVCGEGGNVFTFVQNYEKISFPEAVGRVASLIGYPLSVVPDSEAKPQDPRKSKLYRIMDETIRYTMYELNAADALPEREYLENRGLNAEIREKFQIGYNPYEDKLYRFLKAKGYADADMVSCNVIRTGESGIHDVFSGRITFPIHDSYGNPIAFSARTLNPQNASKYINTNDTEIFEKGTVVYNYHRAKGTARKEGCVYVTEGVTDVIAFARAGIDNCVCTLGTSCTKQQIRLLKSLAPLIVFCYDGDDPGQAATYRAAQMAMSEGCRIAVIDNRTGKDPDEIVRDAGAQGLKELTSKQITWMEFVLGYLRRHTNMDNYAEKKEFTQKVLAEIDRLDDEIDRQYFTDELAKISGFRLTYEPKQKEVTVTARKPVALDAPDGLTKAEELILAQMLAHPEAVRSFAENLGYLTDPVRNRAAMLIVERGRDGRRIDLAEICDSADDAEVRNLLTELGSSWVYELAYDERVMQGAMRKVLIHIKTMQSSAFREQLKQPMNDESRKLILDEYKECLRDLRRYIDEENNEHE